MAINMSSCANVCVYPFFGVIRSAFGFPILLLSRLLYFFIGLIHPMKHTLMGMYVGWSDGRLIGKTTTLDMMLLLSVLGLEYRSRPVPTNDTTQHQLPVPGCR